MYICIQRFTLGKHHILATYMCHAHILDHLAPQQTHSQDINLPLTAEFPLATEIVSSKSRPFNPQKSKLQIPTRSRCLPFAFVLCLKYRFFCLCKLMPKQTSFKQNTIVVLLSNAKVKSTTFSFLRQKKKKKTKAGF